MHFISIHKNICSLLIIVLLFCISIPPRLWKLSTYPPVIVDEPAYLRDIHSLVQKSGFHPVDFQWDFSEASLMYYPILFLIHTFHINDFYALRLTSVFYSLFAILAFYGILRKYTSISIAFSTSLMFSYSYYFL